MGGFFVSCCEFREPLLMIGQLWF